MQASLRREGDYCRFVFKSASMQGLNLIVLSAESGKAIDQFECSIDFLVFFEYFERILQLRVVETSPGSSVRPQKARSRDNCLLRAAGLSLALAERLFRFPNCGIGDAVVPCFDVAGEL